MYVVTGVGVLGISERSTNLRCDLEMINNQILQKMSNIEGVCKSTPYKHYYTCLAFVYFNSIRF